MLVVGERLYLKTEVYTRDAKPLNFGEIFAKIQNTSV